MRNGMPCQEWRRNQRSRNLSYWEWNGLSHLHVVNPHSWVDEDEYLGTEHAYTSVGSEEEAGLAHGSPWTKSNLKVCFVCLADYTNNTEFEYFSRTSVLPSSLQTHDSLWLHTLSLCPAVLTLLAWPLKYNWAFYTWTTLSLKSLFALRFKEIQTY